MLAKFRQLFRIGDIDLGSNQDHRLLLQPGAEAFKLGHDYIEVTDGIRPPAGVRNVNEVSEYTCPFNVPQKLRAQSRPVVRSFNQSWYVSNHIAVFMWRIADGDHPKVGLQRGEWIVGDLRFGR